tara:strand:- start:336 stop:647 length:312 start_codon:yes stop_codon:yes gene_type:complete
MLILRKIEDDSSVIESYYKSSNILYSSYNQTNSELNIIFNSGRQYTYEGVGIKEFIKFEKDDSQGKYFNKNIAKTYRYVRNEDADIAKVVDEVNNIASQAKGD